MVVKLKVQHNGNSQHFEMHVCINRVNGKIINKSSHDTVQSN